MASLLSEVNGTQTEAMWTMSSMRADGQGAARLLEPVLLPVGAR